MQLAFSLPQAAPLQSAPIQPDPTPEVLPENSPAPLVIALTLPTPEPNQLPLLYSSYPQPWQDLIDYTCTYILHDMLFSHPFPAGTEGQKWVRKAISAAFVSYNRKYDTFLDKRSCKSNNMFHDTTANF